MKASDSATGGQAAGRAVVTRFAPSPTGYLHIGGARTALFNWLFARHHGGKYLLRIEDTDRARSTEAAIDAIFDGLRWLGLDGDEPAVFQFARSARHAEVARALLDAGHAYRCYLTPEELAERRASAQAERRPFRIDSEWRDADPAGGPQDAPFVVRIKAPREGETVIEDLVQGPVTVSNAEIDDFVILRSDGTPTYMLAVVVDDHDMGVTHVIRGDDHLNNAFRQLAIIRALNDLEGGWLVPEYGHVPLIHGADGAKLSKRHGALGVDAYRDELGILPEALFNYLLRLGWGHGDDEIISTAQAIEWFDLDGCGQSPSRFDFAKLDNLNAHYLREADDARLAALLAPMLEQRLGKAVDVLQGLTRVQRGMGGLKARAKTLVELADNALFYVKSRPVAPDEKAAKLLTQETRAMLGKLHAAFAAEATWEEKALEEAVRRFAEAAGLGLGKVAQPLRAALTGSTTSPGIFEVMAVLGREEALGRLSDQAG